VVTTRAAVINKTGYGVYGSKTFGVGIFDSFKGKLKDYNVTMVRENACQQILS
jgi:hypothetical protein